MFNKVLPTILLATSDPALPAALDVLLSGMGAKIEVATSLEQVLTHAAGPESPALILLDVPVPAADPALNLDRVLASLRGRSSEPNNSPAIVLISDSVLPTWLDRLAEGVIDDLIPRAAELTHWRVRIAMALRHRDKAHELESFREAAALNLHTDRLTGVGNRDAILAALFRETDRLQRANGTLSLVLVDLDDFGQWNSRLGGELCDDLLCQVAGRMTRLVRTYDALGRPGQDEFLLVLSGCGAMNAMQLAERIRVDVFSKPFHVAEESVTLTACFGITSSQGRSPVVVLREVEQALDWARIAGPGSIECFAGMPRGGSEPMPFLNSSHHEGLFSF